MAAARIKLGLQEKLYLGNLEAKRDWGFAGDYVEAMWLMLQQEKPDDYVIATNETHTVKEFLEEVFRVAELSIEEHVEIDERLFRPHEVPLLLGDPTKAETKLGWKPKIKFKELAKMMYEQDLQCLK
jgi:GDPmannose 4,6-dehydratase